MKLNSARWRFVPLPPKLPVVDPSARRPAQDKKEMRMQTPYEIANGIIDTNETVEVTEAMIDRYLGATYADWRKHRSDSMTAVRSNVRDGLRAALRKSEHSDD